MAEIQRRVIEHEKRNAVSRHLHARNDKEKITAWRSELTRMLHVFNVRSVIFVRLSLTRCSQTELTINTHTIVSRLERNEQHVASMVSDIHRTVVKGQEENKGGRPLVRDKHT